MLNKASPSWLLVALLALPLAPAQAQFGGLLGKKDSANQGGDLVAQQEGLVRSYVGANKEVLTANAVMADAVGLKAAAATARATADALTEGATKGSLEEADKEISSSSDAVANELKKSPKMDAEAKKNYAKGLGTLAKGVMQYIAMRPTFQTFSSSLSSASPLQLPKLQSGTYMVKSFPGNAKNLGGALQNAIAFAKSNDIPVPPDATKAMAAL